MNSMLISVLFTYFAAVFSSGLYSVLSSSDGSALSSSSLGRSAYKSGPALKTTYVLASGSPLSSIGKHSISDYSLGYGIGGGVGSGLSSGIGDAGSGLAEPSAGLRGPYSYGGRGYPYPQQYPEQYDTYDSYDGIDPYRQRSPARIAQSGYHLGYKLGHGVGYGLGYGLGQGIGRGLNTGLDTGSDSDDENGGGGGSGGGRKRGGRSGKLKNEKDDKKSTEKEDK